ncbi:MAG: hypothetical protein V1493_00570 [Candidatus Diapherotrites archaeon]
MAGKEPQARPGKGRGFGRRLSEAPKKVFSRVALKISPKRQAIALGETITASLKKGELGDWHAKLGEARLAFLRGGEPAAEQVFHNFFYLFANTALFLEARMCEKKPGYLQEMHRQTMQRGLRLGLDHGTFFSTAREELRDLFEKKSYIGRHPLLAKEKRLREIAQSLAMDFAEMHREVNQISPEGTRYADQAVINWYFRYADTRLIPRIEALWKELGQA